VKSTIISSTVFHGFTRPGGKTVGMGKTLRRLPPTSRQHKKAVRHPNHRQSPRPGGEQRHEMGTPNPSARQAVFAWDDACDQDDIILGKHDSFNCSDRIHVILREHVPPCGRVWSACFMTTLLPPQSVLSHVSELRVQNSSDASSQARRATKAHFAIVARQRRAFRSQTPMEPGFLVMESNCQKRSL
jgi:hypothetical protein